MADADATATSSPTTPAAPAAAPAAPAAAKPAPAAIDPSEAGRTLQQRRQEHMRALREKAKGGDSKTPAPADKPAEASTEAKKPDAEPDDDLAALMREDRRLKTVAKELDTKAAEVRDIAEVAPIIRQAQAQLKAGDIKAAALTVFGPEAMKDLFWELLKEQGDEKPEGTPDVKTLVRSEFEEQKRAEAAQREKDAAEAKTREAQRLVAVDEMVAQPGFARAVAAIPSLKGADAATVEAYGKYVAAVGREFEANRVKYRAVDRHGVSPLQVAQKAEAMRVESERKEPGKGRPPTTAEVLKALDDDLLLAARELAGVPAETPRPAPVQTFSSAFQQSPGAPAPGEQRLLTADERREAHRKALRERRTA